MILKSMGVECKKDDMDGYAGEVDEEATGKFTFLQFCQVVFFFIFSSRLISISIYSPSSSSSVSQASFLKECFRFQYLNCQFLPWLSKYINSALQHFPSYLVVASNQYGCHTPPSASQVRLQKVGM